MFKRIDHVEIIPKDAERAISFYGGILVFTLKDRTRIGMGALEEVILLISVGYITFQQAVWKNCWQVHSSLP